MAFLVAIASPAPQSGHSQHLECLRGERGRSCRMSRASAPLRNGKCRAAMSLSHADRHKGKMQLTFVQIEVARVLNEAPAVLRSRIERELTAAHGDIVRWAISEREGERFVVDAVVSVHSE
ncbi:hypothetical protein FVE85_6152 [Porphyridium purpureum]|uniref:Uncharacterized protein n=1 Tax=Porphyridium purpureum TaxID=35688 RepID=A0A5J4Z7E7_PORPP|nr:hypothetical protein FVE85_6152 [Porphyridium purpureum]|eukprot:POR1049..scf295_1